MTRRPNRAPHQRKGSSTKPRSSGKRGRSVPGPNQQTLDALPKARYNEGLLLTQNLTPGKTVYDEDRVQLSGKEFRTWNPSKSKLGAAIMNGLVLHSIPKDPIVLYLGAASGTTVSHVSDLFPGGSIYAVEFSRDPTLGLFLLARERENIFPILADANQPAEYERHVPYADIVFMDIAQRNQVEILEKNTAFTDTSGLLMIAVKSRSIDISRPHYQVVDEVRSQLAKRYKILQEINLAPFEKDHAFFLLKPKY